MVNDSSPDWAPHGGVDLTAARFYGYVVTRKDADRLDTTRIGPSVTPTHPQMRIVPVYLDFLDGRLYAVGVWIHVLT